MMFRFIILNLAVLFAFTVTSLCNIAALPLFSAIIYLFFFVGVAFEIKRINIHQKNQITIGLLFLVLGYLLTQNLLHDLWIAPSRDDTVSHAAFLDMILRSHSALIGKINRPGSEWFGSSAYYFYPTGSHALAALWIFPFWKLGITLGSLYKAFLAATLTLVPAFFWFGTTKTFPSIPISIRLFLVLAATTQMTFPLNPLGEGGISRIIALSFFIPIWFKAFGEQKSKALSLAWSALLSPILLFIHPSLLPLIGMTVLFFPLSQWKWVAFGIPAGAALFFCILKTGYQNVEHPDILTQALQGIHNTGYGWFDRLKGPFHYWFSDPLGFGKFLSPKNYFVYLAVSLAFMGKLERKLLLLFFIPFAIAALALIPSSSAHQIGLIFYHSIKRISELTPLLGLTLGCFSATWLFRFKSPTRTLQGVFYLFTLIIVVSFYVKSRSEIQTFNQTFHSITIEQTQNWKTNLAGLKADDVLIIDQHAYDAIRFLVPQTTYTLLPECGEVGTYSLYCQKRIAFGQNLFEHTTKVRESVWWLPPVEKNNETMEKAHRNDLKTIEIESNIFLIKVQ